jgi:ribosomal protein L31
MITNTGKNILAKYLVGQTASYASHIAVGCGPKPQLADAASVDYSDKQSLDFEMFRVPIISRGFVDESGVSKIVLTAELPTQERYEITEVGLFSGASNPVAGSSDSKTIYSFSDSESWKYSSQGTEIPSIYEPLDDRVVRITGATASGTTLTYTTDAAHGLLVGNKISISGVSPVAFNRSEVNIATVPTSTTFTIVSSTAVVATFASAGYLINDVETDIISQVYPVFQTNADNKIFTNSERVDRFERCRFLNNIFTISGNNSKISVDANGRLNAVNFVSGLPSNFIQLSDTAIDFSKNSPTDELRLAFSVINRVGDSITQPKSVRIIVEFSSTGTFKTGKWAIFEAIVNDTSNNFSTNRYLVVKKQLQELQKSTDFSWAEINTVRIYASVIKDGSTEPTEDFYVCLDGFRLENVTSTNSVYGLTGYSVMRTPEAKTIIKSANTTNYIEFRFALDVL